MTSTATSDFPIPITHAEKVFYPQTGFTKGEMLAYYRDISATILPHLRDRPVTLKRYPDGVAAPFFYEKRCPAAHPAFLKTCRVRSARSGSIIFCTITNVESLLWLANRAALELHPYLFRAEDQQRPTMVVFDLDPGPPAGMKECLRTALILRDLLADQGLRSWVKTSGSKGLHLAVPVEGATFAETKPFARTVAQALAARLPQLVTDRMAKVERGGRVFIDWSQNDHGKTTACAYSLRATSTPAVSTPVTWGEVEAALRLRRPALGFDPAAVLERIARRQDPFAQVLTLRQRLPTTH